MMALRNNFLPKLLSLFVAIGLWVYVMSEQNPIVTVEYSIPVRVEGASQSIVVEGVPNTVRVKLNGPRNAILHLDPSELEAKLPVKGLAVGEHMVDVSFTPPSGLTARAITPPNVRIYIDEYAVSYVPVTFKPTDKLPADIDLKDTKYQPERVTISGASRLVHQVKSAIITGKVADHVGAQTIHGDISLLNAAGQAVEGVTATPTQGEVQLNVVKVRTEKAVPIIARIKGTPPRGYVVTSIDVDPKDVVGMASPDVINGLSSVETEPVEVSDATATFMKTVSLRTPDGVTPSVGTVEVTVHIEKAS